MHSPNVNTPDQNHQLNQSTTMHVTHLLTRPKRLLLLPTTQPPPNPNPTLTLVSHYFSLLHSSPNPKHLRHLHARLLRTSLYHNVILSSKLILMYSKHNHLIPHAYSVFNHMPSRNIYSWNIIIGEFSRSHYPESAVKLFLRMRRGSGVCPDVFTLPLVLRACGSCGVIKRGMEVHGLGVKLGFEDNLYVASALVFMYVTMGMVCEARKVFDEMGERDKVLWTAMIAGYAQHGEPVLSMELYREMAGEGIELDEVVMVSLLLVCSQLGWLRHGTSVHGWSVRRCLRLGLSHANALVDMYVKCGALQSAHFVFNWMSQRDVISWSALILGYGLNGDVNIAMDLFDRMCLNRYKPNDVTFLGVLSACAHAGMVDGALGYFDMMKDYGVAAELKHYACIVDCYAKAGLLDEAERFVEEMPIEADLAVLGALLGGCRIHGNVEVAERIAKKLLKLEPGKAGYYVLLANIYADSGRYADAERVRNFMKERNVTKAPGCSFIESDSSPKPKREEVLLNYEIGWNARRMENRRMIFIPFSRT